MTNEELVFLIQSGENVRDNMGLLYEKNEGFIKQNIKRYTDSENDIDDLMQESYFALIEAVNKYNPAKECKFLTIAWYYIRNHIQRYLYANKPVIIPDYLSVSIWKYRKFTSEYIREHGEEPKKETIITELNITPKQLKLIKKYDMPVTYLDEKQCEDGLPLIDLISDDMDIEQTIIDEQTLKTIWDQVDKLDNRKRYVIKERYKNNRMQKDICRDLKKSPSVVGKIEKAALKELKQNDEVQKLADQFDYHCNSNYKGSLKRFKNEGSSVVEFLAIKRADAKTPAL